MVTINKTTTLYIIISILVLVVFIEGYFIYTYYNSTQMLVDVLQNVYETDLSASRYSSVKSVIENSEVTKTGVVPHITGIADVDCILGKWSNCDANGMKSRNVIVKNSGKGKECGLLSKRCTENRSTRKTLDTSGYSITPLVNDYPGLYDTRAIVNQMNFN